MKIIIFALLLLAILVAISNYKDLIVKRNKVKSSWVMTDMQLKTRFDFIPSLLEALKGHTEIETSKLEAVIKARNQYISACDSADMIKANNEMTSALSQLFALIDSYPELKEDVNYIELQKKLTEIDENIINSGQSYNDAVLIYNNAIHDFPANLIAAVFGFGEEPYFR
jgi:LemA protein